MNRAERRALQFRPFSSLRKNHQITTNDVSWNPMFISGQIESGWEECCRIDDAREYPDGQVTATERWCEFTGYIGEDPWLDFAIAWGLSREQFFMNCEYE